MPEEENITLKRSCTRCNQRKVRCDKKYPCGRCVKTGVECIHPGNTRAPRKLNRPPISEIMGQLKELEGEVERLRGLSGGNGDASKSIEGASGSTPVELRPPQGRLVMKDGRSRYVGDEASVVLVDKIRELQEVCDRSDEEGDDVNKASTIPVQILELWHTYKENVAPMIAMLHKPSVESIIHEACEKGYSNIDPAHEALIMAVCFAAVVSMAPQQCLSTLGQDHDSSIDEYKLAVEQALERANLISTQDIHVLQAAVLFLLCLRRQSDSRIVWAQAAIVVRVAQRQGVHRDGQRLGLSPFDIEMRRRLWWHICILDMLCSEDQGTDTQIRPGMFDTNIPSNIDSDALSPDLTVLPEPVSGCTDITLCIIHCEMMTNLYWTGHSLDKNTTQSTQRETHLSTLGTRLEEQYLQQFNLDIPIQWIKAVIARLTLSKAWLVLHLTPNETDSKRDEIFQLAVETVKFAHLLHTNETTTQWAWICKSYKQRHAVAFLLSELCVRPITPETNHAWDVVSEMYNQWKEEEVQTDAMLQKPLARLMERAIRSRNEKINRVLVGSDTTDASADTAPPMESLPGELFDFSLSAMDWLSGPLL